MNGCFASSSPSLVPGKVDRSRDYPTVLIEVLSPSTEDYDRGEKLSHYKHIDTLQEVLLIAHDERRVDLWRRVGTHWTQLTFHSGDMLDLASLECALAVDDIYHNPPDR